MKRLLPHLLALVILTASFAEDASATKLPVITLPVRVHLMHSATLAAMHTTLTDADIRRIFGKVNAVWAPAGIQFLLESVEPTEALESPPALRVQSEHQDVEAMLPKVRPGTPALDVCYVKEVRANGFYTGRLIVVKDLATLRAVPGGLDEPLPRVTSHEIGHALGLRHRQDTTNLMASGTNGFSLNEAEISTARAHAAERVANGGSPAARPAAVE